MSDFLCTICSHPLNGLRCENRWCNEEHFRCKCGDFMRLGEAYEYRGALACVKCIAEVRQSRERERQEIISEESRKTEFARGLDFGNNAVGNANRKILQANREVAAKESVRLREYEDKLIRKD